MTITSSVEVQPLLLIVQRKVLVPVLKPVTPLLNNVGVVIVDVPVVRVHKPLPMNGSLPSKVVLELHIFWSIPADAVVGTLFVMVTSSEAVQPFIVTVQRKIFVLGLNPDTKVVFNVISAIVEEPTVCVHTPPPEAGFTAAKVAEFTQRF